jgi:dTDP-4-dehydrorhamnose 3,5-epimerase
VKVTALAIPDVLLLEPRIFTDDRGTFFETYSTAAFKADTGLDRIFVQDNHSISRRGVVRGMHLQLAPHAQGKLVRVVRGAVFDVAVDVRLGSSTYGRWVGETLSAENHRQLWVPEGFLHGFQALEDNTEFLYKVTNLYSPTSERSVLWNDPAIGINWPKPDEAIVNGKDGLAPRLADMHEATTGRIADVLGVAAVESSKENAARMVPATGIEPVTP